MNKSVKEREAKAEDDNADKVEGQKWYKQQTKVWTNHKTFK